MEEAMDKAEANRHYSRGYQAGRKRQRLDIVNEIRDQRALERRQEFKRQVFLAVLPEAFNAQGWKFGDDPITSGEDRVELAWRIADHAMKKYY